jgi:hypothetical protein
VKAAITADTTAATRMFDRLAAQSSSERIDPVLQREAEKAAASITGIPVDTGRLAASPRVRMTDDGAEIVSDVEYAGYVFRGTRHPHRPPRPPTLRYDARQLGDAVGREVFQ